MLRKELRDSDIPHRTTIRNRILEVWDNHLDQLANAMQVPLSFISTRKHGLTCDSGVFRQSLIYDGHVVRS